jgi:hypothetical protein
VNWYKLNHYLFFCHSLFVTDVIPQRNSPTFYAIFEDLSCYILAHPVAVIAIFFLILSKEVSSCSRLCDVMHTYHIRVLIHFTCFGQVFYRPYLIY